MSYFEFTAVSDSANLDASGFASPAKVLIRADLIETVTVHPIDLPDSKQGCRITIANSDGPVSKTRTIVVKEAYSTIRHLFEKRWGVIGI